MLGIYILKVRYMVSYTFLQMHCSFPPSHEGLAAQIAYASGRSNSRNCMTHLVNIYIGPNCHQESSAYLYSFSVWWVHV